MVNAVLARAPTDANALYLRGVIANRRRDHGAAIAALRQAIANRPDMALAGSHSAMPIHAWSNSMRRRMPIARCSRANPRGPTRISTSGWCGNARAIDSQRRVRCTQRGCTTR